MTLLLLMLLRCSALLICPCLDNQSTEEQPALIGQTCDDSMVPLGECATDQGGVCLGSFLYRNNSLSTSLPTSVRIWCRDRTCRGLRAPCQCDDARLCTRRIDSSVNVTLLCIDETDEESRMRHKMVFLPPNYCADNNDITVDCTTPQDDAGHIILVCITVGVVLLLLVYFCCKHKFFLGREDLQV